MKCPKCGAKLQGDDCAMELRCMQLTCKLYAKSNETLFKLWQERAEKAEAELAELKASVRQAQIDLLDRVSKKIWAGDPCPDRYEIQEILTAEKEA